MNFLFNSLSKRTVFGKSLVKNLQPIQVSEKLNILQQIGNIFLKQKVKLNFDAYTTQNLEPFQFNVIKRIQNQISSDSFFDKQYPPLTGTNEFKSASQKLVFGQSSSAYRQKRIATSEVISGTYALRIGFQFISDHIPSLILASNPEEASHTNIIKRAGLKYQQYPYYDFIDKKVQMQALLGFMNSQTNPGNIVFLHACNHSPTNTDLNKNQWKKVAQIMKKKNLIPFFWLSSQGFGSGNLEQDAWPIRNFAEQGFDLFVCQSFSRNMGLYSDRVGAIHVLTASNEIASTVLTQLDRLIRSCSMYSIHGGRIVQKVISSTQNLKQWGQQVANIATRLTENRKLIKQKMQQINTPGLWNFVTEQQGLFLNLGLNNNQIKYLHAKHNIQLEKAGRISLGGINNTNISKFVEGIKDTIIKVK